MRLILLFTICLTASLSRATAAEPVTFYVQLVRGTQSDQPPEPGAILVGPKLATNFVSALKFKHFWELERKCVRVETGQLLSLNLKNDHQVEIDLRDLHSRKVTAFRKGKIVERVSRPIGNGMTIIGSGGGAGNCSFVIVRRDNPG
jgi:hypothetical protein